MTAARILSLGTKPIGSARRGYVVGARCDLPIPPPATMSAPSTSPGLSGSMTTTMPRSLVNRSTELSPGTVTATLNLRGRNCAP